VTGQAPPEPYLPGSGDRVPAELRLVLAGYAGIAGGVFAGALACAAAAVFLFFLAEPVGDPNDDWNVLLSLLAFQLCVLGFVLAPSALQARIRFSRLLRRPSDPRTTMVTASNRGGRTLVLGTGRGYQPLSEVRLALWMKADMPVPGERVTVYGSPDLKDPLSQQRPAGPGVPRHAEEPLDRPARAGSTA
jgi:hypothetical protein